MSTKDKFLRDMTQYRTKEYIREMLLNPKDVSLVMNYVSSALFTLMVSYNITKMDHYYNEDIEHIKATLMWLKSKDAHPPCEAELKYIVHRIEEMDFDKEIAPDKAIKNLYL